MISPLPRIWRRAPIAALFALGPALAPAVRLDAQSTPPRPLRSTIFAPDSDRIRTNSNGTISRSIVDTLTPTLSKLEMHETTLAPGNSPHAPHRHAHEEVIFIKRGTLEVLQENVTRRAGPGSVVFMASNERHGVKNVGTTPASYLVIRYDPHDMPADAGPAYTAAGAAQAVLRALPDSTRAVAAFPFDTSERSNWFFIPLDRKGLTLKRMSAGMRPLVDTLLRTALSPSGFATAKGIMHHEGILGAIEAGMTFAPGVTRNVRDSTKYYVSVFGTPSPDSAWGWRVEGHHLSVNYTGAGAEGQVVAPLFMGSNPARVMSGPSQGLRLLAAEEDVGRELVLMLSPERRARAIFSDTAFGEMVTRNDPKARPLVAEGLRAGDMSPSEQAVLRRLVDVYAGRMPGAARQHALKDIDDAGFAELRFGWAGATAVGAPHYYRIHGPTVLVEYDNVQTNANHIHTVWRDLRHDFGGDLLGAHYKKHPHVRK